VWIKVAPDSHPDRPVELDLTPENSPRNDVLSVSRLLRFAATPELAANAQGWSAYAGASVRAVGRNELLSRNYDPSGGDLDRENVVTRIAGGIAWIATWGAVTFDVAQDSREFSQQRTPHRFGSLTVSVTF